MPGCQGIFHRGIQRKFYAECRAGSRRLLYGDVAAVILKNFLYHCQPHASTALFAVAHKWLEQAIAYGIWDSWAIICDADFQRLVHPRQLDIDFSGTRWYHFAGI